MVTQNSLNVAAVGYQCPICSGESPLLDVVDLNKSCEDQRGRRLPLAGVPIYYARCSSCGFAFAPSMYEWTIEDFATRIYNDQYIDVDPDYAGERPGHNADMLRSMLRVLPKGFRHLDYGGGDGLLSQLLSDSGWPSWSYDPFVDGELTPSDLGRFDLVTAFEVFEHVPNVGRLVQHLDSLLLTPGIVLFSTLLNDGEIRTGQRMNWWYASPRNGHISLFSRESLERLGKTQGFRLASFSEVLHVYWREFPAWAASWRGGNSL